MPVLLAKRKCEDMSKSEWFDALKMIMPFPRDYLVFDLETSGIDRNVDVIVQIGICRVVNGKKISWAAPYLIGQSVTDIKTSCG